MQVSDQDNTRPIQTTTLPDHMSQEDPEQPQQKLQQKQTLKLKTTVLGFDEINGVE